MRSEHISLSSPSTIKPALRKHPHLRAKRKVFGGEVGRAGAPLQEEPLGLELDHLGLVGVAKVLEEVLLGKLGERVKPLRQERQDLFYWFQTFDWHLTNTAASGGASGAVVGT